MHHPEYFGVVDIKIDQNHCPRAVEKCSASMLENFLSSIVRRVTQLLERIAVRSVKEC
jgi:hypothetical protein